MADRFRLTIAQLNPTMGDLAGNAAQAKDAWDQFSEGKAAALPGFETAAQGADAPVDEALTIDALAEASLAVYLASLDFTASTVVIRPSVCTFSITILTFSGCWRALSR